MQFEQVASPCHAMQTVYILSDEGKLGNLRFELNEGEMTGIGSHPFDGFTPPRVPIPDEFGVAGKGFGRGKVFGLVLRPESRLRIAEGAESAFLRDAGSGQRDQFARP